MAQKLIQTQEQKQIQIQRLSQQQMLQVKLLEMPLTELEESINSELDDNPALEMGENDEPQSTDTNLLDGDSELTEEEKSEREEREDALERALESIGGDDEMPQVYGRNESDNAEHEEMI